MLQRMGRVFLFLAPVGCRGMFPTSGMLAMRRAGMALRQLFETETEVPLALKEHYVEKDGKWLLQLDPPAEDVTGLKNALGQERNLRRDTEKTLSDLKVKFEGIDPDDYRKLQDRVKGLDDAEIYDRQGIEALVLRRTESMKQEHERQMSGLRRENDQLKGTAADLDRRWRQDRIKTALLDAAARAGVAKGAMPDAVQRGMAVFVDLDEHGNVVSKNGDDIRYGKDGISPLSPDEWMGALKTEAPHLWPASTGSGAPAHHTGNGAGVDWASLPPAERLTRYRELNPPRR